MTNSFAPAPEVTLGTVLLKETIRSSSRSTIVPKESTFKKRRTEARLDNELVARVRKDGWVPGMSNPRAIDSVSLTVLEVTFNIDPDDTFFENGIPVVGDNVEVEDENADGYADSVEIED